MVEVKESLTKRIYCVYDKVLQVYENLFTCSDSEFDEICEALANDVSSKYWKNVNEYAIYYLGDFNGAYGDLNSISCSKRCELSQYVNQRRRDIQTCIQTLNFLPTGYFKMPKEMQEDVQSKIDECVKFYVDTFVKKDVQASTIECEDAPVMVSNS